MQARTDSAVSRSAIVTSAFLAVMFVATAGTIAWPRVNRALGFRTTSAPPLAYHAGEQIDVPDVWYRRTAFTLVIFARSNCGACERAQPFLKGLVSRLNKRTSVVLASPGEVHVDETEYAEALGLDATQVRFVAPGQYRVKVTPTLILVNRQGKILGAWQGMPPEEQPAIRNAIQTESR